MSSFHVDRRRARLGPPTEKEARLPVAHSAVVIAGLSALSWAVLISVAMVVRAVL